jgi:hypothetical protein
MIFNRFGKGSSPGSFVDLGKFFYNNDVSVTESLFSDSQFENPPEILLFIFAKHIIQIV